MRTNPFPLFRALGFSKRWPRTLVAPILLIGGCGSPTAIDSGAASRQDALAADGATRDALPDVEPSPSDAVRPSVDAAPTVADARRDPDADPSADGAPIPIDGAVALPDRGIALPDGASSDALPMDHGVPTSDAAHPDAAHPDAVTPDAAPPDAVPSDAARPDAARPDAARPDAAPPDAVAEAPPDARVPDAAAPGDLCPADPQKNEPGLCGCGVSDADEDGDGFITCEDACPSDPTQTVPGPCGCNGRAFGQGDAMRCVRVPMLVPDGFVNDVALDEAQGRYYLAGRFDSVGLAAGSVAALDPADPSHRVRRSVRIGGRVRGFSPQLDESTFVFGQLWLADEDDAFGVLRVRADGTLDPDFRVSFGRDRAVDPYGPYPSEIASVSAVARSGDRLFLQGLFNRVGGESRDHWAAVDARTGAVLPFTIDDPAFACNGVSVEALQAGDAYLVAYNEQRDAFCMVDADTGRIVDWRPQVDDAAGLPVAFSFVAAGDTLQVFGNFVTAEGEPRAGMAAYSLSRQTLLETVGAGGAAILAQAGPVNYAASGDAIVAYDATTGERLGEVASGLGAGGPLTSFGPFGLVRASADLMEIQQVDLETGVETRRPGLALGGEIGSIAMTPSGLLVGGRGLVERVESTPSGFAAFDSETGRLLPSEDPPGRTAEFREMMMVEVGPTHLHLHGKQSVFGPEWLTSLRRDDLTAGTWRPSPDKTVEFIRAAPAGIVVGANDPVSCFLPREPECGFYRLSGEQRAALALVDAEVGRTTPWNPVRFRPNDTNRHFFDAVADDAGLYVAGSGFGVAGTCIRSIDPDTAAISDFGRLEAREDCRTRRQLGLTADRVVELVGSFAETGQLFVRDRRTGETAQARYKFPETQERADGGADFRNSLPVGLMVVDGQAIVAGFFSAVVEVNAPWSRPSEQLLPMRRALAVFDVETQSLSREDYSVVFTNPSVGHGRQYAVSATASQILVSAQQPHLWFSPETVLVERVLAAPR